MCIRDRVDFRQIVHVVSQFGLKHVVGKHGVEKFAFHLDAVILEDNHIFRYQQRGGWNEDSDSGTVC